MMLVFVSNYFNHQQKPLCERLYKKLGKGFVFVATKPMREERRQLGYGMDSLPEYVVEAYDWKSDSAEYIRLIDSADMVIVGSAPEELIKNRIKIGKPLIRYSERPLKNGFSLLKYIPRLISWHKKNPICKKNYMLCASAYTVYDYSRFFLFKNRMFRWGYFPEVKKHNIDELISKKEKKSILWCGRFIDWKHPDDAVMMAGKLSEMGIDFKLRFVGTGEMEDAIKAKCRELQLEDKVEFLGSMRPEEVRGYMEKSSIYIATSDFKEGWGAVINEAMSSGCSVVASHAMGSVPYLIKDGKNGVIYESGNIAELTEKVALLTNNTEKCNLIGRNAYETLDSEWNADIASDRLISLIEGILSGEIPRFDDGLCSLAPCIKNNWIKNRMGDK